MRVQAIGQSHRVSEPSMRPLSISPTQNRLLAALTAAELEPLLPYMALTPLALGGVLHEPGSRMDHVYFPVSGLVSLLYTLQDGHTTELAVVGNDGCIGLALFLGGQTTPSRAVVQIAGFAYRIRASTLVAEFHKCGGMSRVQLLYVQALMTQMTQTAVCNRHHSVEQQLRRWLLVTLDRLSSNKVRMTQELIASMLGVRRPGINKAARKLQAAGVIEYKRGQITVPDRAKLEAHACECYAVVKKEADRLFGSPRIPPNRAAAPAVARHFAVPNALEPGLSL
jgi:CRP-like cAMP-binding protein